MQPLYVSGNEILTGNATPVVLRGVDYTYFIDGPTGSWTLPNGQTEWNTWDVNAIISNLDAIKAWGCNCIRVLATTQWWIDNTDNFQSNIETFVSLAEARGIYVDFVFWRNNGTEGQVGLPYVDAGNNVINSTSDFVNLWTSVAGTLRSYPNVMFELWNEPVGVDEASWLNVTQQCVTAIRGTGASNLIVAQWGMGIGYDFTYGTTYGLNWITAYPLTDPLNNLIYSTHIYRNAYYNDPNGDPQDEAFSYSDMLSALTIDGALNLTVPLWVGEIGCSQWASNMTNEYAWFNNTLSILDQYGIGYCGWAWAPWGPGTDWSFISGQPNYAPNQAGQILQQQIAASISS
jgi:hypothetical protein